MSLANRYDEALAHYVMLAQQPGWWAHALHQVRLMDAGHSGLYRGLEAAWRAQLAALGFEPAAGERGEWWNLKSEAERKSAATPARRRA
jgi:hypothetical protein